MRLQVIQDSLFSRLGSGPFSGRGKSESRNRTRDLRDTRLEGKGSLRTHFKWSDSKISIHRYCWTSHRLFSKETVILRRWGREKRNLVKIELQKLTFRAFVLRQRNKVKQSGHVWRPTFQQYLIGSCYLSWVNIECYNFEIIAFIFLACLSGQ